MFSSTKSLQTLLLCAIVFIISVHQGRRHGVVWGWTFLPEVISETGANTTFLGQVGERVGEMIRQNGLVNF